MPLYDYDCAACGRRIEVVHGVHAPGPTHCPNCGGGPLRKAITAAAVHFKGTGWAKKERRTVAAGASKAAGESESTADAPRSDKDSSTEGAATKESSSGGGSGSNDSSSKPSKSSGAGTATKTDD
jgi:putative FmdB family regulatory protein